MGLAFSARSPAFSSFALYVLYVFFTYIDSPYFVNVTFLLVFSLRYAAPLSFNRLIILG